MNRAAKWTAARAALLACVALAGCSDDPSRAPDAGVDAPTTSTFHDPLSMPEEPTLDPSRFDSATACAECHPVHYEQWSRSMHAYAVHDPVFRALVRVRQEDLDGEEDQFCMQCHTAIGTRGGEVVDNFSFDDLSPIVQEGITCESCHRVTDVVRPYNSGHVLDPMAPIQGTLPDPVDTPAHLTETSELLGESRFCAGCHDVIESDGLHLERPYAEWLESPAGRDGRQCNSCHMPEWDGRAAVDGPERTGLHHHRFVGVDVPLSADWRDDPELIEEMRRDAAELLAGSADLQLRAAGAATAGRQLDLVVEIHNRIDAHALPTGTTFLRQLWLEVVVTDATGAVLYRTGHLDGQGDLRDHWSGEDPYGDPDLITLTSGFLDDLGAPELFPWRAAEHRTNAIPPLHSRAHTLFVPVPGSASGPLSVDARLRFRTHPPFLLRALGLEELIARVETYDIATAGISVPVEDGGGG